MSDLTDYSGDPTWLAAKRYTGDARRRGRPQRYQRRFATEAAARKAIATWVFDNDVKAVWLWGPPDSAGGRPAVIDGRTTPANPYYEGTSSVCQRCGTEIELLPDSTDWQEPDGNTLCGKYIFRTSGEPARTITPPEGTTHEG